MVQRCYLRPHPVRLKPDHHSRGMTATGSHIDFGFTVRSTTLQGKDLAGATLIAPTAPHPSLLRKATFPQGKAFLCPGSLYVDFCRSDIESRRAGHAAAPTRETESLLLGAAHSLSHGLRHDSPLLVRGPRLRPDPYIAPAGISPGFFSPLLHFCKVYDILFPDNMQYFVREYGCFSLREYGRIGGCGSDCLDSGRSVRAFTT